MVWSLRLRENLSCEYQLNLEVWHIVIEEQKINT